MCTLRRQAFQLRYLLLANLHSMYIICYFELQNYVGQKLIKRGKLLQIVDSRFRGCLSNLTSVQLIMRSYLKLLETATSDDSITKEKASVQLQSTHLIRKFSDANSSVLFISYLGAGCSSSFLPGGLCLWACCAHAPSA